MLFFPECLSLIHVAPRLDAETPRLVISGARLFVRTSMLAVGATGLFTGTPRSCLVHPQYSLMLRCIPNISHLLQWYSCTSYPSSHIRWSPASIPSWRLLLSWKWPLYIYTPHSGRHFWGISLNKMHFADVYFMHLKYPVKCILLLGSTWLFLSHRELEMTNMYKLHHIPLKWNVI